MTASVDRAANYLSSRSADVILSDIRPTKLNSDALRSINVLLDEFLWLLVNAARSFSTDKLKAGLLKILPTPLGKEALLEAEVELRAYWERTSSSNSLSTRPSQDEDSDFPLQPAFELLRLKCEAYSTLNDSDEDPETEGKWHAKLHHIPSPSSKAALVAPAALYLTAILESICERILSNTSRVAARDSSKSTASIHDLYIALCEDDNIYALFKTMKVHDQISAQTKAPRPRRSKSFSRTDLTRASSRATSPPYDTPAHSEISSLSGSKPRLSSDSSTSNSHIPGVPLPPPASRNSSEKSRGKAIFGRASGDRNGSQNGHGDGTGTHQRSGSSDAVKRATTPFDETVKNEFDDAEDVQDFDDLMRSGATMKVSLTPDRLKSFEIYNKEKNQRANRAPPSSAGLAIRSAAAAAIKSNNDSSADSTSEDLVLENLGNGQAGPPRSRFRQVDSIVESEEEAGPNGSFVQGRPRNISLSKASSPGVSQPTPLSTSRSRSNSAAHVSGQVTPTAGRKLSLNAEGSDIRPLGKSEKINRPTPSHLETQPAISKNNRPVVRSRESLDLDDIMNGVSDEESVKRTPFTPKSARLVDTSTRDIISFLNEGPPEFAPLSPSVSLPSSDSKSKPGRIRSIVSKLTRGASSEKLAAQISNDEAFNQLRRSATGRLPLPPLPPPLSAKKSLRNISEVSQTTARRQAPISPPSSPLHETPVSTSPRSRQGSTSRKAVPVWEKSLNPSDPDLNPALLHDLSTPKDMKRVQAERNKTIEMVPSVPVKSVAPSNSLPNENGSTRRALSKSTHHAAVTPPASPASTPFTSQVKDLQRLMSKATTADECRLLLDMCLAQSGFPIGSSDPMASASTSPSTESNEHQSSLVEALLSNGEDGLETEETDFHAGILPTPRSTAYNPASNVHIPALIPEIAQGA